MTFFLNNPPPEPNADEESTTTSHSARTRPLFKQDAALPESLSGQHISLSAYISKHLQETERQVGKENQPAPTSNIGFGGSAVTTSSRTVAGAEGQYLNSLDVELAAGLEQFLPTPLFRLRVMKKRLDGEIGELKMRLNKYERLPAQSDTLRERIEAVRSRLATLEAHERQVSQELASAMAFGPTLYYWSRQVQGAGSWLSRCSMDIRQWITRLLYGPAYLEVEAYGEELQSLQELFADRMRDRSSSGSELSQILNRYEQAALQVENAALRLKPLSFVERLWQEAKGLLK
jgi:hypothetical protein